MKRFPLRCLSASVLGFVLLLSVLVNASSGATSSFGTALDDLSWITGDWQNEPGGKTQIDEHWNKPSGGSMIGMSRTVIGDKTAEFEYLRIEQRVDGIFYVAHPQGRCPGTDFKLTRSSATEAVFENPQHDFPKRIIYRKTGVDGLTASIDGGEGTKSMEFPMRRALPHKS
jgi:hypothetical protein